MSTLAPEEPAPSSSATAADAPPSTPSSGASAQLKLIGSRYAMLGIWAAMIIVFCTLMPISFMRISTAQAILSSQSALVFLAVAALVTFLIGEIDLSFASVMGISATIVPVLVSVHDVNIAVACLVAVGAAAVCGLINAFFIVVMKVSSLVVTLGTASLFLGIAQLISGPTIVAISNPSFSNLALQRVFGLPLSFYYALVLCIAVAYFLAWTPTGRHIVFVGSNREVARLAGINVDLIRAMAYLTGAVIAGLAGILLVMTVGGFDPLSSNTYLLPALAAVFLGSAIVRPGQFNPIGTWLGIYFLATGIFGLQLLGYTGWVQDAFYGAGLVLAVTTATLFRSRRGRA